MTNAEAIKQLHKDLQPKAQEFLNKGDLYLATSHNWKGSFIQITDTIRSKYYQAGLFSIGRDYDFQKRIWLVSNKNILKTHTLDSKHLEEIKGEGSKAFDIAIKNIHGVLEWPNPYHDTIWNDLASIAEDVGLFPGARWHQNPDWDHYSLEKE